MRGFSDNRGSGLFLGICMVCLFLFGAASAQGADVYKIGVLQPFSGPFSVYGEDVFNAVQAGADEINAAGGLLGRKIVLVKRDTKTEAAAAVREAKDLILREKIDALICGSASHELLATIEVTREHKMIHLTSVSNAEKATVEAVHPYFFQIVPNTYMESVAVGKWLATRTFKTYSTIAFDYEWGHSNVETIDAILKAQKPATKKISEFWPPLKETDFSSYITASLSQKPELLIGVIAANPLLTYIRQARGYELFSKLDFACPGYEVELMALGKEFPENMRIWTRAPFYGLKGPRMEAFQSRYLKLCKKYPTSWAVMSYDTVMILADAVKRAKGFDRDAIARALESGTYKTLRGELRFRDIDHQMNAPTYFATTSFDKEKGFCVGKDVERIPGEQCWKSTQEIKAIRAEKNIKFTPWSARAK